jgi:hypothetical protein
LAAAQGLWWRQAEEGPVTLGAGSTAALEVLEAAVGCRGGASPSADIECVAGAIAQGTLVRGVQEAVGLLAGLDDA